MRKRKMAIEYVSSIGCQSADLHSYEDREVGLALDFIWNVNPAVFLWLTEQLTLAKNRHVSCADDLARLGQAEHQAPTPPAPDGSCPACGESDRFDVPEDDGKESGTTACLGCGEVLGPTQADDLACRGQSAEDSATVQLARLTQAQQRLIAEWSAKAIDAAETANEAETKASFVTAGGQLERASTLRECIADLAAVAETERND